jgi:hypothetical protein
MRAMRLGTSMNTRSAGGACGEPHLALTILHWRQKVVSGIPEMNGRMQAELDDLQFHWSAAYEIGFDKASGMWSAGQQVSNDQLTGRTPGELRANQFAPLAGTAPGRVAEIGHAGRVLLNMIGGRTSLGLDSQLWPG